MRSLYFGEKAYEFPDQWSELTRDQYLHLVDSLMDYTSGKINALGCRVIWFCKIAGIDIKQRDDKNDLFWENIYRAANLFTFFFELNYFDKKTGAKKSLNHLPKEIRDNLRKYSPDMLPDIPEYKWASKLTCRYTIDAVFARNLIPDITLIDRSFAGYRFDLSGNLLTTSLTAGQFTDAVMAYNEHSATRNKSSLRMLVKTLYFKANDESDRYLDRLPDRLSYAILLNFQAVLAFLMHRTRYAVIWSRTEVKKSDNTGEKLSVGLSESIYQLAKDGFGSVAEMSDQNLIKYLDLLLKNIIDSVKYLHDNKKTIEEIAQHTGLSIANVKKII